MEWKPGRSGVPHLICIYAFLFGTEWCVGYQSFKDFCKLFISTPDPGSNLYQASVICLPGSVVPQNLYNIPYCSKENEFPVSQHAITYGYSGIISHFTMPANNPQLTSF